MRDCFVFACIAWALAQHSVSADSGLKDLFESKIKVEWER